MLLHEGFIDGISPDPSISGCTFLVALHHCPLNQTYDHLSRLFFVLLYQLTFAAQWIIPKVSGLLVIWRRARVSLSRLDSMAGQLQATNWVELGSLPRCGLWRAPCVHYRVWDKELQPPWDGRGNRGTPNWAGILKASIWVTEAKLGENKSHAWAHSRGGWGSTPCTQSKGTKKLCGDKFKCIILLF